MAVKFAPFGNNQFVDSTGAPASGWKIYTYVAGSSTLATTYTTSAGSVAQSNPIVLNSLGFPTTGQIWLTEGVSYKLVLTNASDVVQKTEDNISGVNDTNVSQDEWVSGPAPTYIGATSFSLVGDQTSTFQIGRRVKTTNSGGTIYSTITNSAFAAVTTVTVVNDSGTLDSGLSAVSYGLLSATNPAVPGQLTLRGTTSNTAAPAASTVIRGGQIGFPATQIASTDPNTLDDYEEGTWAPVVGGTATYTLQRGKYTKIGNLVTFMGHLTINSIGTGSTNVISGLPFTAVNDDQVGCISVGYFSVLAVNAIFLTGYVEKNTSTVQFQGLAAAAAALSTLAIFGNGANVYFSGHYYIS